MSDQGKTNDELTQKATNTLLKSVLEISDCKQAVFPVVSVSNKTGFFINVIRNVLEKLPPRQFWLPGGEEAVLNNKFVKLFRVALDKQQSGLSSLLPSYKEFNGGVFYIDYCFNPPGIGLVLSGINRGKSVKAGDTLLAGPFGKSFHEIRIKSLHNNMRQLVPSLDDHHRGCLAIAQKKADIKREHIGKGTILLSSPDLIKNVCYRFKAVISLFTQSLTLKTGYTPVIHLYTIRQSARMIVDPSENNGNDIICFGGKSTAVAVVTFKFKQHPEFVEPYNMFVLRSGDIQGIGMILSTTSIMDDNDANPDPHKNKKMYRRKHPNSNRKVVKA
jgi:GTPase